MDILMLGHLIPECMEKEVIEKSSCAVQFASTGHLNMLLDGIKRAFREDITLLNLLPVGSYPKRYSDLFIRGFEFETKDGIYAVNIGYFNLTVAKKLSKRYNTVRMAKKRIKESSGKKIIFLYAVTSEYLYAAKVIKKANPDVHICLIVPDLPAFTDIDKGDRFIYRLRAKWRTRDMFSKIRYIDSFVFLTEQMSGYFNTDKPYAVIEGLACENPYFGSYNGGRSVVYTGTFTKKYGILELLDAFSRIERKDVSLVLAGGGEAEKEVIEAAARDNRIIYKGAVSMDEAKRLQAEAFLNINPRRPDGGFTKYSFPSKLMEYLASGRPAICFKLEGIPDEYDSRLFYFNGFSPESMAEDIIRILDIEPEVLAERGRAAADFLKSEKNPYVQCMKIKNIIKWEIRDK